MSGRRSIGKKGFELQFTWLFVLIAGAIILGFFFMVLRNQLNASDEDSASKVQGDMDFIFRASQGSRSSEKIITLSSRIKFSCDDGVSQYSVDGSPASSQYNYIAAFSPSSVSGKNLLLKTEFFKAPFHVMPFMYATSADVEYVFVGDGADTRKLFAGFPANTTKHLLADSLETFTDKNYDSIIFIAESSVFQDALMPHKLSKFSSGRYSAVRAVSFEATGGFANSYGLVSFYSYDDAGFKKKGQSYYFTFEQLLGAAISGDFNIYSCQFEKSIRRFELISSIHQERISSLLAYPAIAASCESQYSEISGRLGEIIEATRATFGTAQLPVVFEAVQTISLINTELVERTNCPPLY